MVNQPAPITDPQEHTNAKAWQHVGSVDNAPLDGDSGQDNQRVLARQTPSGTSRGVQQLGGPNLTADSGNKQIIVSDPTPRVLMGSQPTFGEGLYVSKDGIDVLTANNASDFVFNSNQNTQKIVKTDLVNISFIAGTVSTISIAHKLDFVPIPAAYLVGISTAGPIVFANLPLPTFINASIGSVTAGVVTFGSYLYCATDSSNLYFQLLNATGSTPGNFTIRYYLYQETSGVA